MKNAKLALVAVLGLALTFTFSCSGGDDGDEGGNNPNNGGTSSPSGGGSCNINGGIVTIGSQTWMAENLNCNVSGSLCYRESEANCSKYGRLYDWNTAKKVCPFGWHLPTNDDWNKLVSYVENDNGCSKCAGKYLRTSDWGGNDKYRFAALPSGFGSYDGLFGGAGSYSQWWSISEDNSNKIYYMYMYSGIEDAYLVNRDYGYLYSVRCIKD